jgi:uncharacterized membrane protein
MGNQDVPEERGSTGESQRDPEVSALEKRVARLEVELAALRREIAAAGKAEVAVGRTVPAAPPPPPPIPQRPPSDTTAAPRPAPEVWAVPPAQPQTPSGESFEERLGSQIFNRIAIVLLLIGVAFFLKMAIDRQWIGPIGRVAAGLVAGAALVLWSERFRQKGFAAFSYSLKAVGSGVLYLSVWAAFHLFHLLPANAALGLMLLVTAWNAYMAWVQDSELLAVYALAGGFATPVLLSTGGNHEVFLFIYLLAIDVATAALVRLKTWPRLLLGAFPVTVAFFIAWYAQFYAASDLATTAVFIALFGAVFGSVPLGRKRTAGSREQGTGSGELTTARVSRLGTLIEDILLPLANGAFVSLACYFVLEDSGHHALLPWLTIVLAAAYLGLMQARQTRTASAIHLSLAVVFLTIAIPLKASGHWITVGWLVEGLALLWVAARLAGREVAAEDGEESYASGSYASRTLRRLGSAALALGFCGVLADNLAWLSYLATDSFFSADRVTTFTGAAIFAGAAWLALKAASDSAAGGGAWARVAARAYVAIGLVALLLVAPELLGWDRPQVHAPFATADFACALVGLGIFAGVVAASLRVEGERPGGRFWMSCAAASTIAFNLIAVLTGVREIVALWSSSPNAAAGDVDAALQQALAISAFLMLYGAALLAVGFWKRSGFLRWQALALLVFSILKAFLYDMRSLTQGYRVASLLGLGALLMAISFAYQKDWLNLRVAEKPRSVERKADSEGAR